MYQKRAVVGTEVFAYSHIVAHTELPAVAEISTLLHIDGSAALGKQMLGTAVAQAVRHLAQYRYRGLGQLTGKGVIDYKPKRSHLSARIGLWRKSS